MCVHLVYMYIYLCFNIHHARGLVLKLYDYTMSQSISFPPVITIQFVPWYVIVVLIIASKSKEATLMYVALCVSSLR